MTILKTMVAASTAAMIAGSAMAGGFSPVQVEEPVTIVTPPPPEARGSLPGWVIPAVIVAALIGVAASSDEDDSGTAVGGTGS